MQGHFSLEEWIGVNQLKLKKEDTGNRNAGVSPRNDEEFRGLNMYIEEKQNLNCINDALALP